MTEEDQKLVALAALHGARFYRRASIGGYGLMWCADGVDMGNKWTVGRAAEFYLWKVGLRSDEEHWEYDHRTDTYNVGQDVDPAFLESVLA